LDLQALAGQNLPPFEAGAHVDVQVNDSCVRQYSLCNDPADSSIYRLGVLLEPKSRGGSAGVHKDFQVGRNIRISRPRNAFPLDEAANRSMLVAGGIGITPILAMAWRLHGLGHDFDLHYCCRTRARAAFLTALAQAPFADRVHLHFDDDGDAQRLNPDQALRFAPGQHLYVCGPQGFADFILDRSTHLGWPKAALHVERFSADVEVAGSRFELRAERSGLTLTVPEDKSIAQVLLEAGVDVSLSCEQGVCGTCITRVLSGKPDHRDLILTDEEKKLGQEMTICCSRSLTPVLTLDI